MGKYMRRHIALVLMLTLATIPIAACNNAEPSSSSTPAKTTLLATPIPTPTLTPMSTSMPTPTPTATPAASPSPSPVIAAGTKPFLPIHNYVISDGKSVYYVNEPGEVYKKVISSNKKIKLASYANPIHQMFLDYDRNLYYLVKGYSEEYDDGEIHGWLYKYSGGKETLVLSDIEGVCGINDRYIYYYKEVIYHDDGYYIDDVYCFELSSGTTTLLFTLKGSFDSWTWFFSRGDYIYYDLENVEYSYNVNTGIHEKLFDSGVLFWFPDIMDPDYIYISGFDKSNPESFAVYNLKTQNIERVLGILPLDYTGENPLFYIDGDCLLMIIGDPDKHVSIIRKIDLDTDKVVYETTLNGDVESSVIHNGYWYLYSDVIDEDYNISDKKLSAYNLSSGKLSVLLRTNAVWESDAGDNFISDMGVAGGCIYGYYTTECDNLYYHLGIEKKIK